MINAKKKNHSFYTQFLFVIFSLVGAFTPSFAQQMTWPFDQRQIVLVKKQAQEFPDERTLAQLMDAFVRLGRVKWVTQKAGVGQIVPFEVPSDFPWRSAPSVRQLGLRYASDGVVALVKRGVQVTLEWYGTADGEPLFFETVNLPDATRAEDEEARRKRLLSWIEDIWSRIPGNGYITTRDMTTVTVEGASQVGLKVGMPIEFRRLEKVDRHPLLKTLVGVSSSVTGRGVISEIKGNFAIAQIEYESQVDPIQNGDRYSVLNLESSDSRVLPETKLNNESGTRQRVDSVAANSAKAMRVEPKYKILDISIGVVGGKHFYEEISENSAEARNMKALTPGFSVGLLAYVNREISMLSNFDFSFGKFSNLSEDYGVSSFTLGLTGLRVAGAYRFIFNEATLFDGELVVSGGYRRVSLSLSQAAVDFSPSSKMYSGIDLGVGLQVPLENTFRLHFGIYKLFNAQLLETPSTSAELAANQVWFAEAGLRYLMSAVDELFLNFQVATASTTFSGEAGTRPISSSSTIYSSSSIVAGYTYKF